MSMRDAARCRTLQDHQRNMAARSYRQSRTSKRESLLERMIGAISYPKRSLELLGNGSR